VARDRQRARQRRQTPAPEPTEHAFPDVEEARLAEAGGVSAESGESVPAPAPDEAEHEAAERAERHGRPQRGRLITFLGHVIDELRRVQWPDRHHVGQSTVVVLGFVVLAGGYLGLMDAIWKPLVEAIL
jgi:preprotein translocase SecE subunit